MMTRLLQPSLSRPGVGLAALAMGIAFLPSGSVAAPAAADPGVDVVNTETVQVYTDADGTIETRRVYEQLTLTGDGKVRLTNPVAQEGLRNLDEFGGLDVSSGEQHVSADVDGIKRMRTVSDFEGDLPLDVSVEYTLDGKRVDAADVVGEDGSLGVTYTVRNLTGEEQEISYPDGKGGTVTETVEVPVPMVGSLTTTLPDTFTEVHSDQANMAGDGKGGTKMSFTMTLVPPIGSDTATFGYTARVTDGVVPRASLSALPVNPLESPTFKSAATSYKSGAETGEKLVDGATEIDSNLIKLRDGAAELLAGLIQLSDGAEQLNNGLANEAAPGAARLADGADQLDEGLGRLDSGAKRLSSGAGELSTGTGTALTGSEKLHSGLKRISGGLDQLSGAEGLPKAKAGVKALQTGVGQILAGFGSPEQEGTLLHGLTRLETGSADLKAGLQQLRGDAAKGAGLDYARAGVDQVQTGLQEAVKDGGTFDQLIGGLNLVKDVTDCGAICRGVLAEKIIPGVVDGKAKLVQANDGLIAISGGLSTAVTALDGQLLPGITAINGGLTDAKAGAQELRGGASQVSGGLTELRKGLAGAITGVFKLANGANRAETGSGDLSDGLSLIDGGANRLSEGAGELAVGTGKAEAGTSQLAAGASKLAGGLGEAADGSRRLAEGLNTAKQRAPALPDGAQRLSTEGMSRLIAAGEGTAQQYGRLYAIVDAGSRRAETSSMAIGAPTDARGLTAYSFEIQGESGEGGRNVQRMVAGVLVLGLGLGAFALRRRFI